MTVDEALAYVKGRGKVGRSSSSGKGFGRRKNPKDRVGNIAKRKVCDIEKHFAAKRPKGKGKGKGREPLAS